MADDDIRDEIARLEGRIEELSESIERCRKIMLLSKLAIAAGAVVLLIVTFGTAVTNATALVGAIAAVIGGCVMLGSNSTTLEEFTTALNAAEAQRAQLIGTIDLRLVTRDSGLRRLH